MENSNFSSPWERQANCLSVLITSYSRLQRFPIPNTGSKLGISIVCQTI